MLDRILISHVYSPYYEFRSLILERRTYARRFSFFAADYGNSTFFFLEPSITSTEGRTGAGAGVVTRCAVSALATGRGRVRLGALGRGAVSLFSPGSGTSCARSPARR